MVSCREARRAIPATSPSHALAGKASAWRSWPINTTTYKIPALNVEEYACEPEDEKTACSDRLSYDGFNTFIHAYDTWGSG